MEVGLLVGEGLDVAVQGVEGEGGPWGWHW